MEPVRQMRDILKAWREKVEVLPAAGGALKDMLHPDAEEKEERAFTDDRIFETVWERPSTDLFRPTPPLEQSKHHLFRYFLDGSLRTYFWALHLRAIGIPLFSTRKSGLAFFTV